MGVRRPLPAWLPSKQAPAHAVIPVPAEAQPKQRPEPLTLHRAVVCGPTGTLGVNLIHELIANEIAVYAVCRPDSARIANIPTHPLVTTVFCALDQLAGLPDKINEPCDAFFHLAWEGAYGALREDLTMQLRNVDHTLDAVRAAHVLSCKAFIGAGSQSEFGHVDGVLSPDLPCHPDTAYGQAKLLAGRESKRLCESLGLRQNWCRILSLYGPFDGDYTMVMTLIRTLLSGERPQCTAGEQIWDYLYAKDAARAFLLTAERGLPGAVYCVGSGQTRTLKAYISAIRDAIDLSLPIGFGERPYYPHQVMHLEADLTALTADTGFLPRYSFEDGIRETVAWMQERMLLS